MGEIDDRTLLVEDADIHTFNIEEMQNMQQRLVYDSFVVGAK